MLQIFVSWIYFPKSVFWSTFLRIRVSKTQETEPVFHAVPSSISSRLGRFFYLRNVQAGARVSCLVLSVSANRKLQWAEHNPSCCSYRFLPSFFPVFSVDKNFLRSHGTNLGRNVGPIFIHGHASKEPFSIRNNKYLRDEEPFVGSLSLSSKNSG